MANVNNPLGFIPYRHRGGGDIRANRFPLAAANSAIGIGCPVKILNDGTVDLAAAGATAICIGVSAEYKAASSGGYIMVYDDPMITYRIQCNGAIAATDVFYAYDHAAGTVNATTGKSTDYLNSSAGATDAMCTVLGLIEEAGNAWGAYQDVEVIIRDHVYGAKAAGL